MQAAARTEARVARLVARRVAAELPLLTLVFVAKIERLVIVPGIAALIRAHRAPPSGKLTLAASRCLRRSEPHKSRCCLSRDPPPPVQFSRRTESRATDTAPCRPPGSHPPAIR